MFTLKMKALTALKAGAALGLAGLATGAQAHVTLEQGEAVSGSPYKAVLRVGHGCDGAATTQITVTLPAGFRGAKPMPKEGWTLALRKQPLAEPYESHGRTIREDVTEISWTARDDAHALQDAWYDEFVLRGTAPATQGPVWFKVRQRCTQGEWDWSEVPASGASTAGLKAPAVRLLLTAPAGATHAH